MLEQYTHEYYRARREYKEKIQRRALRIVNAWEWIEGVIYVILFVVGIAVALFAYGYIGVGIV